MGRDIDRIHGETTVSADDAQRVGYYTRTLVDVIRRAPKPADDADDMDELIERVKKMPELADALRVGLEEAA